MDPAVASAASVQTDNAHAGGHAARLTLSEDGRSLLKWTSLEEAHVYCWLRERHPLHKEDAHIARLLLQWIPEVRRISKAAASLKQEGSKEEAGLRQLIDVWASRSSNL
ncbi:hypothetical protein Emag_003626 [Eimeria magna]